MLTCRGRCETLATQIIGGMSFSDRSMPVFTLLIALGGLGMVVTGIDFTAKRIDTSALIGAAMILIGVILWFMFRRARR
jgi:drug/metabolite transporter (DMT)-like permease